MRPYFPLPFPSVFSLRSFRSLLNSFAPSTRAVYSRGKQRGSNNANGDVCVHNSGFITVGGCVGEGGGEQGC